MKKRFSKQEIRKYDCAISQSRERGDRDFWATLYGSGLTFEEDIRRFLSYCESVGADDIIISLTPRYGHEHRYYPSSRKKSDTCIICSQEPLNRVQPIRDGYTLL